MTALKLDKRNANRGTRRGREMLQKSLSSYGAGRSILADKDGNIIAGNKTFEAAQAMGMPVKFVETDGSELVVVKRNDLDLYDDPKARQLAYADNRVAEVDLAFDPAVLADDLACGVDLSEFWTEKEMERLLAEPEGEPESEKPGSMAEGLNVTIAFDDAAQLREWHEFVEQLAEQFPDQSTGQRLIAFIRGDEK